MRLAPLQTETRRFVSCQRCTKHRHYVEHLLGKPSEEAFSFGPWYCPLCGEGLRGQVQNGVVDIEEPDESMPRRQKSVTALLYEDLLLLVESGDTEPPDHNPGGKRYFFEQHTCPTNFLSDVVMALSVKGEDADPHGMFTYVGTAPFPDDLEHMDFDRVLAMLGVTKERLEEIRVNPDPTY